jgi:Response regulators consisting of a CheY-like receiver domain and a winged-helix DNA-binding domain
MRTVAIIEDADDNRDLLYYLLRDEFRVLQFSSGEDALNHFSREQPDLIVLDIWLPGVDGMEVLRRVRQNPGVSAVPVIALTANAMAGDREKYLAAGFNAYTSKPISQIDDFLDMVRRLLRAPGC